MKEGSKTLSNDEVKHAEAKILEAFADYCELQGLHYSLAYGTLIGAARHKGFIPWDDDIDVVMPRSDYELFRVGFPQFASEHVPHLDLASRTVMNGDFAIPFEKVVDKRFEVHSGHIDQGIRELLWIDVFPLDAVPASSKDRRRLFHKAMFYKMLFQASRSQATSEDRLVRGLVKRVAKPIAKLFGLQRIGYRRLIGLTKDAMSQETGWAGNVVWPTYGPKGCIRSDSFEQCAALPFEGRFYCVFRDWERYLEDVYGDWSRIPPKRDQQSHELTVYAADESYESPFD